jgi:hypothetical protein
MVFSGVPCKCQRPWPLSSRWFPVGIELGFQISPEKKNERIFKSAQELGVLCP